MNSEKTAEWHGGIGKLMAAQAAAEVQQLILPYIQIAAPLIAGEPPRYGGSPWIAKACRGARTGWCPANCIHAPF